MNDLAKKNSKKIYSPIHQVYPQKKDLTLNQVHFKANSETLTPRIPF